ncbi:hypothetical protein AEYBE204_14485 [Asticcacaulis sp. YBE204]|nr:hypothetical protein AEYBE204_14485 [Asticcacaulis sp. YBE204]
MQVPEADEVDELDDDALLLEDDALEEDEATVVVVELPPPPPPQAATKLDPKAMVPSMARVRRRDSEAMRS